MANLHIVDQALLAGAYGGPSVEEGDDEARRAGGAQAEAGKGGTAGVDTDAADQMNDSRVFEGKGKGNAPAAEVSKPESASLEDSDDSDNSGSDDQSSSSDDSSDEYGSSGDDSSSGSDEYDDDDSDSSGSGDSVDETDPRGDDPSASALSSARANRLQEKVTQDQHPGADIDARQNEEVISASAGDTNKLFK